nr:response regulator [Desulfohalovibrio reitneri]
MPAEGADEALRRLEERSFDLVITDFDMPGKSGVQLAGDIGRRWPGLPVLLISGRAQAFEAAEGVDNVVKVLAKPFTGQELAEAVCRALGDGGREGGGTPLKPEAAGRAHGPHPDRG